MRYVFMLMCGFMVLFIQSQESQYTVSLIDESIKENANAVIQSSNTLITISAYNQMNKSVQRVVTVLNASGEQHINAYAFYDQTTKIKKLEAVIYDKNGYEIKKVKKNNFKDVSAVPGGTMYSDNRVKYLDYTATSYPFTVKFTSEIESTTTAFITPWLPLEGYYVSTRASVYEIINTSGVTLKSKKTNFEGHSINEISEFAFTAANLKAIKPEVYSVDFKELVPYMRVALEEFDMKGVKGSNKNWVDFGKWMNNELIDDTRELPQEVINEVKALIPENATDLDKMKIVYKFMQDKTRYISVQIGIGGWRPIIAEDVDRLGYGDCKGLSNYTKALLEAVGISSHYAIIYGGRSIKSIDKDFSATEGNHAVLAIPYEDDLIWLECTSQTVPFGYIANFTDDRDALLITPEGGQIVHTTVYEPEANLTETKAEVELTAEGHLKARVEINTMGVPYNFHSRIEDKSLKDQKLSYKEDYWEDINNLSVDAITLSNDSEAVRFSEVVDVTALKYARVSSGRLFFKPNVFNKLTYIPPKTKNRVSSIKIDRGYTDKDEYFLKIPDNTTVEALPRAINMTTEFGHYSFEVTLKENQVIHVKRELVLFKGLFEATQYNDYRKFRKTIAKSDQSKMVLKLN